MDGEGANAGSSYSPGTVKADYTWDYYKWGSGDYSLGKYVNMADYGMAEPDGLTTLLPVDDAATKNWGSDWRMPTETEFQELIDNTNRSWTTENDVAGWKCANKSDATKYIFLPAAGYRTGTSLCSAGSSGDYWSSSLNEDEVEYGRYMEIEYGSMGDCIRYYGRTVRPVMGSSEPPAPTGRFTINADGDKVEFAPGNLYWDGINSKWKFEENQWDYSVGEWSGEDGDFSFKWDANHVSLFFWSKTASVAYAGSYSDGGASTDDVFFTNATETTVNPNFHVNGETGENQWRTLSKAEWAYLLGTASPSRDNAKSLRAWKELDSGTHIGFVILPDGTEEPSTVLGNITSTSDLATSGAVFLPAAGYRYGTGVHDAGSSGNYWSGTPSEDDEDYAYYMSFSSGSVSVDDGSRYDGYSVRLVR